MMREFLPALTNGSHGLLAMIFQSLEQVVI
jgi:hypothetical protein